MRLDGGAGGIAHSASEIEGRAGDGQVAESEVVMALGVGSSLTTSAGAHTDAEATSWGSTWAVPDGSSVKEMVIGLTTPSSGCGPIRTMLRRLFLRMVRNCECRGAMGGGMDGIGDGVVVSLDKLI